MGDFSKTEGIILKRDDLGNSKVTYLEAPLNISETHRHNSRYQMNDSYIYFKAKK